MNENLNQRIDKLTESIDLLVDAPSLTTEPEKQEFVQCFIDTLSGYPKPQHSKDEPTPRPEYVGAYMYVSIARCSVKLAQFGFMPYDKAFEVAGGCLEAALSLLTD